MFWLEMSTTTRKLSKVSAEEMAELNSALFELFEKYSDHDGGITATGLTRFCAECKLLDSGCGHAMKETDCTLIFEAVKLRRKTFLNFDRFQEAVRKVAMTKEVTYQELIQRGLIAEYLPAYATGKILSELGSCDKKTKALP